MISPERGVSGRIRAVDRVAVQTLGQVWHDLRRFNMLMRVICRQGNIQQGAPAPTAAELRASLKKVADSRKPTAPTAPQTPEGIRAALRGEMDAHEASAPQAVEEIRADQHREALWSAEETLRNTPEALVAAADELESIIADGIVPASVVPRLGSIVERLRGINLHDLDVARQQVGTTARAMDVKKNNRQ